MVRAGLQTGLRGKLRISVACCFAVVMLVSGAFISEVRAETQGTFRGEVVAGPRGERATGLLYLKGRDGNVRRVVVVRAAIVYDAAVPAGEREKPARMALSPGAEVRVTALVDANSGEWTASRVEVISNHSVKVDDDDSDENAPDEVNSQRNEMTDLRTI